MHKYFYAAIITLLLGGSIALLSINNGEKKPNPTDQPNPTAIKGADGTPEQVPIDEGDDKKGENPSQVDPNEGDDKKGENPSQVDPNEGDDKKGENPSQVDPNEGDDEKRKRLEAEKAEKERKRLEDEKRKRLEAEKAEKERKRLGDEKRKRQEAEKAEKERKRLEDEKRKRQEAEKAEKERKRLEDEKRKRLEAEKAEKERKRLEDEKRKRQEAEKAEKERKRLEDEKRKRLEAEKAEKERKRLEDEKRKRLEAEKAEKERKRLEDEKRKREKDNILNWKPEDKDNDKAGQWEKPIPVKVGIDYTVATDYIFRGVNYTKRREYSTIPSANLGSGLSHQITAFGEVDLGLGRVGYRGFFEFNQGQNTLNPYGITNDHLQEDRHSIYAGYKFDSIGLDAEAGYIFYNYPKRRTQASDQEIYLTLKYDDSYMWRALGHGNIKEPILNPYLNVFWGIGRNSRSTMVFQAGIFHKFYLADYGLATTPIFKDLTIKPSIEIGWDKNWLTRNSNLRLGANQWSLGYINYGLEMNLDLKNALKLQSKDCGNLYLKGFINYSQALEKAYLDDEFYGGMSVGYSW